MSRRGRKTGKICLSPAKMPDFEGVNKKGLSRSDGPCVVKPAFLKRPMHNRSISSSATARGKDSVFFSAVTDASTGLSAGGRVPKSHKQTCPLFYDPFFYIWEHKRKKGLRENAKPLKLQTSYTDCFLPRMMAT